MVLGVYHRGTEGQRDRGTKCRSLLNSNHHPSGDLMDQATQEILVDVAMAPQIKKPELPLIRRSGRHTLIVGRLEGKLRKLKNERETEPMGA
jgi:hypothetical protein